MGYVLVFFPHVVLISFIIFVNINSKLIKRNTYINKYNETYKHNMREEYQDILDKLSNDNLNQHFNHYIYIPRSNITRAFTYKKIGPNNKNLPKTDEKSKYSGSNQRVISDSKGKKGKIPKTHSNTKGKESSSNTRGVSRTQETSKSTCTHTHI